MTPESQPQPTRRHFYYLSAIYALWAVIAGMLSVPAFVYLFFPPRAKKSEEWVDAADLTQLQVNEPQEVTFRTNKVDGWKVTSEKATAWVVKTADNKAIAFAPQCTHLGCAYHWDDGSKTFVCPCHTSAFGIDGRVLGGPAPRPLDRYEVKISDNRLQIGPLEPHA
jgi:menaquinol-cytochrome c reductase iron-sulfur subunit